MHPTESMYGALEQALVGREVLPEDLTVTVERIPMVYLVWAGITLMSVGIAVPLVKELVRPIRKKQVLVESC